jgi:8-oxo-dGTP diphosphatase
MPKLQKIGVSAFIHTDGKVLLLKRAKDKNVFPEFWELPGGKLEYSEKPEIGIAREVKEETGLKIKVNSPYATFSYLWGETHFVDIQFFCTIKGKSEVKISSEHQEYRWAGKNQLADLKITKQMREVILKGFKFIK